MAHIRRSTPDSSLGLEVKVLRNVPSVVPVLGSGGSTFARIEPVLAPQKGGSLDQIYISIAFFDQQNKILN